MIKEITLPDLGEGIDGAEVSEIPVSPGDTVSPDDTILVLESDRTATFKDRGGGWSRKR
jgi:pyruvate/2-oxoglutarate dehydrogenase complex dihydrolipoamide acyltransferase (E2) component